MRVLMITPYLPYPLYSGGQVRIYNLLKNLAGKYEITLFSFIRQEEETQYLPELLKYCRKVEVFPKRKPWVLSTLLRTTFSPYPLLMAMYDAWEVRKKIQEEIRQRNYELIHVECFYVMHNLPSIDKLPVVLTEQNIEHLVYQRFVKNFHFTPVKPLMYFDVWKIKHWEKYFWRKAQKVVAMSKEEAKLIETEGVEIVSNGVDTEHFKKRIFVKDKEPTVVFVGDLRWIKNRDALKFLYFEIWPHIRSKIPGVRLLIVGRHIPGEFKNLSSKEVLVKENVEHIREAYQRADLLLAPIRIGGGSSYKVLEAMASSLPVVTTTLGIEGIEAKDGQEVIIRDNPEELAKAVADLLTNEKKRNEMGKRAQKLIAEKYDWGTIAAKLGRIWEEVGKK